MKKLFFLIGASGSGKTTSAKILENKKVPNLKIFYFDSVGVPSSEAMIKEYGSIDEWQRAKTIEWVKRIKNNYLATKNVILDAQTRPSFIEEACKKTGIILFETILFDCKDSTRKARLIARGHSELANDSMMNWARYLKKECVSRNCKIIDTSYLSVEQSVSELLGVIEKSQ